MAFQHSIDPAGLPHVRVHHSSRMLARQTILIKVELALGDSHAFQVQSPFHADTMMSKRCLYGAQGSAVASADWVASHVTDISRDGCGLVSEITLVPGMRVQVMFPGFDARGATIAWASGNAAGCAFVTPLPVAILDYILRMSDPAARG